MQPSAHETWALTLPRKGADQTLKERELKLGSPPTPHTPLPRVGTVDWISHQSPSEISATLPRASCSPYHIVEGPRLLPSRYQPVSNMCNGFHVFPKSEIWMAFKEFRLQRKQGRTYRYGLCSIFCNPEEVATANYLTIRNGVEKSQCMLTMDHYGTPGNSV